ncbi:MAG: hypothetical protein AAGF60_15960 [Pseudomonadota bacterium]
MTGLCVIHAGFHKTGTSTIEHALMRNAGLLRPYMAVLGRPDLGAAPRLAKVYSDTRRGTHLARFQDAFAAALPADGPVLVSCVDLIGRIPGHPNITDYRAAPALLEAMAEVRPAQFAMGLRPPAEWLRSVWAQNLKVHREVRDHTDFAAAFRPIADLEAQLRGIEARLGEKILRLPLRAGGKHPDGPAGPLLDLFDVPDAVRKRMELQVPLKVGLPREANAALLEINRSDLSDDDLRRTKGDALAMFKRLT